MVVNTNLNLTRYNVTYEYGLAPIAPVGVNALKWQAQYEAQQRAARSQPSQPVVLGEAVAYIPPTPAYTPPADVMTGQSIDPSRLRDLSTGQSVDVSRIQPAQNINPFYGAVVSPIYNPAQYQPQQAQGPAPAPVEYQPQQAQPAPAPVALPQSIDYNRVLSQANITLPQQITPTPMQTLQQTQSLTPSEAAMTLGYRPVKYTVTDQTGAVVDVYKKVEFGSIGYDPYWERAAPLREVGAFAVGYSGLGMTGEIATKLREGKMRVETGAPVFTVIGEVGVDIAKTNIPFVSSVYQSGKQFKAGNIVGGIESIPIMGSARKSTIAFSQGKPLTGTLAAIGTGIEVAGVVGLVYMAAKHSPIVVERLTIAKPIDLGTLTMREAGRIEILEGYPAKAGMIPKIKTMGELTTTIHIVGLKVGHLGLPLAGKTQRGYNIGTPDIKPEFDVMPKGSTIQIGGPLQTATIQSLVTRIPTEPGTPVAIPRFRALLKDIGKEQSAFIGKLPAVTERLPESGVIVVLDIGKKYDGVVFGSFARGAQLAKKFTVKGETLGLNKIPRDIEVEFGGAGEDFLQKVTAETVRALKQRGFIVREIKDIPFAIERKIGKTWEKVVEYKGKNQIIDNEMVSEYVVGFKKVLPRIRLEYGKEGKISATRLAEELRGVSQGVLRLQRTESGTAKIYPVPKRLKDIGSISVTARTFYEGKPKAGRLAKIEDVEALYPEKLVREQMKRAIAGPVRVKMVSFERGAKSPSIISITKVSSVSPPSTAQRGYNIISPSLSKTISKSASPSPSQSYSISKSTSQSKSISVSPSMSILRSVSQSPSISKSISFTPKSPSRSISQSISGYLSPSPSYGGGYGGGMLPISGATFGIPKVLKSPMAPRRYTPSLIGILSGKTISSRNIPKILTGSETRYPVRRR